MWTKDNKEQADSETSNSSYVFHEDPPNPVSPDQIEMVTVDEELSKVKYYNVSNITFFSKTQYFFVFPFY